MRPRAEIDGALLGFQAAFVSYDPDPDPDDPVRTGYGRWLTMPPPSSESCTGVGEPGLPPGPFRGHVVDFLQLPHWPIFNVADMCVISAALLIMLATFTGRALDGRRLR